ncbi:type VII secretion protein EccCb [Paractinoplanes brasiliensis]|uniref:S-DNA-T family DNA segregation ATPase FtsK/SpoIIIE n=1 Tax=Paractinoplanes brasiliensis TaxID=52695 RepID=A0A4R6J9Z8_9ACTN|nr:type VII secretion protein EccCb [Actinoplanes brasiliensis]TDO32449.1 S-DNA-T family DNA segregation ATPase FtsK/SpoIIIE [Actinoplanes brasiliensis]GID27679.1 hypothetical protein Abr02nite_26620 [Actinoplanes brasiliensis]
MSAWTTSLLYQARTLLPRGALELACHAAVPAVLDPGFLHLLRINFFLDPPLVLSHEVEASLLHSPLFHETGDGLYEVDPQLRRRLLAGLDAAYGLDRLKKVALLLEQYTNTADPWQPRELEYAQRLTALSMIDPARAADWLAGAQQSRTGQETLGQEWFVAMRERLAQPETLASEFALLRSQVLHPQPTRPETVSALGELALLPGADLDEVLPTLVLLAHSNALAAEIVATLRALFPSEPAPAEVVDGGPTLLDLLGLDPSERDDLRLVSRWRSGRDFLRVPIGVSADGEPVLFDLKGPAQEGMGPHGLLVGATGSGKSELLRTLVTALAVTHPPDQVNFLLVDPYGGSGFAPFESLPHTAAVITDLRDEPGMIERLSDAISGELVRRQDLLRRSGDLATVREYEQARPADAEPVPTLLIIVDEFSALLAAVPSFIDLLLQVLRLGRSLGVHLLLAGQGVAEGRLRGLETHLSYRLGLRMFSAAESRVVLGVPDAYELPLAPGHGYLKYSGDTLVRFKAAYVSGDRPSMLESVVDSLRGYGWPARRIWLPPLDGSPALDELGGPVVADPVRGLRFADADQDEFRGVPIALVDMPFEQQQDVLWLRLGSGSGHNVVIVGEAWSGKSTTLRALVCGLALTRTPEEAQVYCLGLDGDLLSPLRVLPHVGAVTGSAEPATVRRVIDLVDSLLRRREQMSGSLGAAAGDPSDVYLLVDGWDTVRSDFPDLELTVKKFARRGSAHGIHVMVTATSWAVISPGLADTFEVKLELRLDDPAQSTIDRHAASTVMPRPGHGITTGGTTSRGRHLVTARPELTTMDEARLIESIAKNWRGKRAPQVPSLPRHIPYEACEPDTGLRLPIGVAEDTLEPVSLDFRSDPHVTVSGDDGSGKSTFLRALATTITRQLAPDDVRIAVVDYRRSLLGAVPSDYLYGFAETAEATAELVAHIAQEMRERLPGRDVTAEQLRRRSWWAGPEMFVLVDDYELVTGDTGPLAALRELVSHGHDIGMHLAITRSPADTNPIIHDPVLSVLDEMSSPTLLLSRWPEPSGNGSPPGRARLTTRRMDNRVIQLYDLPRAS